MAKGAVNLQNHDFSAFVGYESQLSTAVSTYLSGKGLARNHTIIVKPALCPGRYIACQGGLRLQAENGIGILLALFDGQVAPARSQMLITC